MDQIQKRSGGSALPLKYLFMTARRAQFWLPPVICVVFWVIVSVSLNEKSQQVGGWFLGAVLPLLGGVFSAGAVLDDPALELQFATPRPAWRTLLERLGPIFGVLVLVGLVFQAGLPVLGRDLSWMGSLGARQVAWLLPTLVLMGLGCAGAFALANSTAGALLVGLIWIIQAVARDWWLGNPLAQYAYLFLAVDAPQAGALPLNQGILTGLSLLLALAAWLLLRRQERYIA